MLMEAASHDCLLDAEPCDDRKNCILQAATADLLAGLRLSKKIEYEARDLAAGHLAFRCGDRERGTQFPASSLDKFHSDSGSHLAAQDARQYPKFRIAGLSQHEDRSPINAFHIAMIGQ